MMDSKIYDGYPQQKSQVAPSSFRTAKRWRKICCCSQLINLIQGAPVLPMMNLAVSGMITPSMLWKADSLAKIFTRSFCKVESLIHNLPSIFFEKTKYQLVVEPIDLKDVPKKVKIGSFPNFFGINIKQSLFIPSPRKLFDKNLLLISCFMNPNVHLLYYNFSGSELDLLWVQLGYDL